MSFSLFWLSADKEQTSAAKVNIMTICWIPSAAFISIIILTAVMFSEPMLPWKIPYSTVPETMKSMYTYYT